MNPFTATDLLAPVTPVSKPTFWGWDSETWTAIGTVGATIVALAVSIIGAFSKSIKDWIRKPRLKLLVDRLLEHSELVSVAEKDFWQLRLPIKNNGWRGAATH